MNAHSFLNHHIIILLKQVTTLLLITLTHCFLVLAQIAMLTAKITYNQDRPRKKRVYFQFMVLQFFFKMPIRLLYEFIFIYFLKKSFSILEN